MPLTLPDLPTVADVAAMMRARTKGRYMGGVGGVEGSFDASTRPTDVQVQGIIDIAQVDVVAVCGWAPSLEVQPLARFVVLLRSCMLTELSYFPEQITPDQSPYDRWQEQFESALGRLRVAVDDEAAGSEVGGAMGRALARGRFPRARLHDSTQW